MKALIFIVLFISGYANASIYDLGDASGIQHDPAGNFYKTNTAGTVSATKSGSSLSLLEKVNIPTSKGTFAADLARSVPVDINRVGKAIRILAVASGPVGLAVSTVDAICSLTTICNQAGQWMMQAPYDPAYYPDQTTSVQSYCTGGQCSGTYDTRAGSAAQSCKEAAEIKKLWGNDRTGVATSETNCRVTVTSTGNFLVNSSITKVAGCPPLYVVSGSVCVFTGNNDSATPTASDWDAKESLLNDSQFIQPLLDKNQPVPVGVPSFATPQKIQIGSETKTTKDGSGNTTGTETTTIEAEISQPSAAENPTNSPSVIKITENSTVNNYNTNNQLTSSVTTVTNNATPTTQQEPITITIDNVPDVPLQTVEVPGTFSFSTWGSGSCPAPKSWVTMFGTHEFSYQLTCDFATTAKPIILLIAAIVSFMIVASIRTE